MADNLPKTLRSRTICLPSAASETAGPEARSFSSTSSVAILLFLYGKYKQISCHGKQNYLILITI